MKDVIITAIVPANEKEGRAQLQGSVTVKFPETVEEAVAAYGAEALLSNAFANWRVTVQAGIRGGLKRGESPESIAARYKDAKMGVAQQGQKMDPVQAYLAMFASASPEKQKEMMAELRAKAAGQK